jgi:hypothetical protein
MDKTPVVVLVPVTERVDKTHVVPAAAVEELFAELNLPESAVLVIRRDHGAVGYAGRQMSPEKAEEFLSRFGEDLQRGAASRPTADRDKGATVRELVPPVHLKCRTGDCGHQFWARKPVDEEPPVCPKCQGPTSILSA